METDRMKSPTLCLSFPKFVGNTSWWRRRTKLERRVIRVALLLAFINVALVVTIALILTKRGYKAANRWKNQIGPVCLTPACTSTASTLLKDMHLHENPCDNFYKFTCGGFLERTVMPDDMSVYDCFTVNEDVIQKQLKTIMEKPDKSTNLRPFHLARKLYNACMNTTAIEQDGLHTLRAILNELGGWPVVENTKWVEDRFDWKESMYKLRKLGLDTDYLLSVDVAHDEKNTSRHIIILDEAEFGTYEVYLSEGFKDKIVQSYYDYMVDVAVLLGASRTIAMDELKKTVEFETQLADFTLTYEEIRNVTGLYNPMTIKELQQKYPQILWKEYINNILDLPDIQVTDNETIDLSVPGYISKLIHLLEKTPKRVLANYIIWRVVSSSAPYITESFYNRKLQYDKILEGNENMRPRWKECLIHASEEMPQAIGALYVRKHSSKGIKSNVIEIVSNIKIEFINALTKLDWMDETTKMNALEKATSMAVHIAYPDELLNDAKLEEHYAKLDFVSNNYFELILNLRLFNKNYRFGRLRKPFNRSDWTRRSSATDIDAFYKFEENSINFNAGMLQGVFYNKDRPQYMNYGSIGYLIGHEITHAFDNEGSEYDKNGNLVNWWKQDTKDIFKKKAQCMVEQYGNFTAPGVKLNLNGVNTQEENIADNGGVRTAYSAYRTWSKRNGPEIQLPGLDFTSNQMFWISVGHTWCAKYRDEYLKMEIETDRHSPNSFRVLGPLRNSEHFAKDFNCPAGSNMNPKEKCRVW